MRFIYIYYLNKCCVLKRVIGIVLCLFFVSFFVLFLALSKAPLLLLRKIRR